MTVFRQGIICENAYKPSSPKWLSGLLSHSIDLVLIEPKIKIGLFGAAFRNDLVARRHPKRTRTT